jgi:hypothetical protein
MCTLVSSYLDSGPQNLGPLIDIMEQQLEPEARMA